MEDDSKFIGGKLHTTCLFFWYHVSTNTRNLEEAEDEGDWNNDKVVIVHGIHGKHDNWRAYQGRREKFRENAWMRVSHQVGYTSSQNDRGNEENGDDVEGNHDVHNSLNV